MYSRARSVMQQHKRTPPSLVDTSSIEQRKTQNTITEKQKSVNKHKTKHTVQKYLPPYWILSSRTKQSLTSELVQNGSCIRKRKELKIQKHTLSILSRTLVKVSPICFDLPRTIRKMQTDEHSLRIVWQAGNLL